MPPPVQYPLPEMLKAVQALRGAANLPPETFPVQAFVSMISDEIEALRGLGCTDQQIVTLIQQSSAISIDAVAVTENYASPEERRRPDPRTT